MDSNKCDQQQLATVLDKMKADDVKFVRFEETDMYGVARSKTVSARHFREKVINGLSLSLVHLGLDPQGNFVPDSGYQKEIGYADGLMFPDLQTYVTLPWCKNTGRILIEPTYKGKPVNAHPRTLAKNQLGRLKEMGFSLLSAHEHEFYLVDANTMEPYTKGHNLRATVRNNKDPEILHDLMSYLLEVGVDTETFESEIGPGQVEITYKPSFGITSADVAHTFRTSVKEIALQHGYMASFMSKPFPKNSGSSCHFNHSLWDATGEQNMMYDHSNPTSLSEHAQYWIAGIIAHTPAISLLMAPTINCLKRFEIDSYAPINATWGIDNRSAAIRVKLHGERGMYVENRIASAGGNPYLILAATVAAGIDGIQRQVNLPSDVKGDAYDLKNVPPKTQNLPTDMETALGHFNNDKIIQEALGEEFCKCFVAHKKHELRLEKDAQSEGNNDWEQDVFFEYL